MGMPAEWAVSSSKKYQGTIILNSLNLYMAPCSAPFVPLAILHTNQGGGVGACYANKADWHVRSY
jgi:hypothetical protein